MLFLLLMTFILLTTVITPLVIINVRKKTKTPAPAPIVTDVSIDDELNINKYYIYHVASNKSLQSTLGSDNPIHFENVDDGKVFKMTLDGREIGYNKESGMIINKGIYVDNVNFKLFKLDIDNYIITNELEDMFLIYDDIVKAFYLVDEKYINTIDKYNYVKLRVTRTPL